jgi:transcriptional regulator with XRE-family HTH domain
MADQVNVGEAVEEERAGASTKRPNSMDAHVGSRVRLRRMMMGMSQEKLGEQMGLTFQQIQKYERGINRVSASRLWELAKVLGVSVQFFFDELAFEQDPSTRPDGQPGFAETQAESTIVEFLGSRDGLELNRAFVRIKDARARRSIVELVRSLASDTPATDGEDGNLPSR